MIEHTWLCFRAQRCCRHSKRVCSAVSRKAMSTARQHARCLEVIGLQSRGSSICKLDRQCYVSSGDLRRGTRSLSDASKTSRSGQSAKVAAARRTRLGSLLPAGIAATDKHQSVARREESVLNHLPAFAGTAATGAIAAADEIRLIIKRQLLVHHNILHAISR